MQGDYIDRYFRVARCLQSCGLQTERLLARYQRIRIQLCFFLVNANWFLLCRRHLHATPTYDQHSLGSQCSPTIGRMISTPALVHTRHASCLLQGWMSTGHQKSCSQKIHTCMILIHFRCLIVLTGRETFFCLLRSPQISI